MSFRKSRNPAFRHVRNSIQHICCILYLVQLAALTTAVAEYDMREQEAAKVAVILLEQLSRATYTPPF
jgi:hypothetical protein